MIGDDPNLVEEKAREDDDRDEERRVAPPRPARQEREPDERRQQRRDGQVEIGEGPQRVGVVRGELTRRMTENEPIQSQEAHGNGHDGGQPADDGRGRDAGRKPQDPDGRQGQQAEQRGFPPRQFAEEPDRQIHVHAHGSEQVHAGQRRQREEDHDERGARTLTVEDGQHQSREDSGDAEHGIEPEKQEQAEEHGCDRGEEAIAVHVRARVGQERREEQRLHHHLGIRVAGEPDLDHVEREQRGGGRGRGSPGEPDAGKIHRDHAQDRPRPHGAAGARQPVEPVPDRDRCGEEMRKLADDGAGRRVLDEEPHEPDAVVVLLLPLVRRKEQIARERRHRRDDGIGNDDRAALRDLDPFVHVDAGILAADDVFRRTGRTARDRAGRAPPERARSTRRAGRGAAAADVRCDQARGERGDCDVGDEQPRERVLTDDRQRSTTASETARLITIAQNSAPRRRARRAARDRARAS